jgi:hypothetical protein
MKDLEPMHAGCRQGAEGSLCYIPGFPHQSRGAGCIVTRKDTPARLLEEATALSPRHRVGKNLPNFAGGSRKSRGDEADTNAGFGTSRQCLAGRDSKKPVPDLLNQTGRGVLDRKDSMGRGSCIESVEYVLEGFATKQRKLVP